jgi:hypothetical protein
VRPINSSVPVHFTSFPAASTSNGIAASTQPKSAAIWKNKRILGILNREHTTTKKKPYSYCVTVTISFLEAWSPDFIVSRLSGFVLITCTNY